MKTFIFLVVISVLFMVTDSSAQTNKSDYRIVQKFHLTGDGFWDYCTVDETTGLLYVSHGTEVQIVNVTTGVTVATIDGLRGVHGIALVPELNKGFISCGGDATVQVFDLKTYKALLKIKTTGENPDCIMYDPFTKRIFTFNGKSANATVINAKTLKVVGTIPLDGKPEFARTNGNGRIYVNIEDKSEITEIDPSGMKVIHVWSISPGEEPSGLALDNETHRLFSVCSNEMMVVVDAETGKVITTLPTGAGTDGCAFDPGTRRVFSSNGEGTMTVVQQINANSYKVLENVQTQRGARTITLDKRTHHLYLPTAGFGPPLNPTNNNPRPRPQLIPGSFVVLDVEPVK